MAEPGWYADPSGRYPLRWYDGSAWTEHAAREDSRIIDPQGRPAGDPPEPTDDPRWLPPPQLPDAPRLGPFALGIPSFGGAAVPEEGFAPVRTGNRALDLPQNYVNEYESRIRRDAGLLRSSLTVLRELPYLRRFGVVLGVLTVAAFFALLVGVYLLGRSAILSGEPARLGEIFLLICALLAAVGIILPVLSVCANVLIFSCAVAAGLARLDGGKRRIGQLLRDTWTARRSVVALAGARLLWWRPGVLLRTAGWLYEAFAVFVVPVSMDARGIAFRDAQRRSEELVRSRWGPGRFRALGLPATNPWSVVYSWGVFRFGYKAPFIAAGLVVAILLVPLGVGLLLENTAVILAGFAWMWGLVAVGGLLWWVGIHPMIQGLLRAYLYHYAKTGVGVEPFRDGTLHACLREEIRASVGLTQRTPEDIAASQTAGFSGLADSVRSDPGGWLQSESGLTLADFRSIVSDGRRLYRDGKAVRRAVRAAGRAGIDQSSLIGATGLAPERCRVATINLLWNRKLRAGVADDASVRYLES